MASRMARAPLAASQLSLPSAAARPPSLPSCIPAVYSLGGFPACVCDDHPGPTFRPDPVSPATPNVPGSLLPPHPAHILAQCLPPPFLLCLQWPQPFPPGEGRWGPGICMALGPSRCDPDSTGAQPHRADVSSLRAGMKGWFLASLQGRRNSHRFAPSLSLLRGGVDGCRCRPAWGGSGSGGEWIYQIHRLALGRLCRASALAQREMEGGEGAQGGMWHEPMGWQRLVGCRCG